MPDTIGPHLLGRRKSAPDERNYRLAMFMGDSPPTKLDVLLDAVMRSRESKVSKAWMTEATRILNGLAPDPLPPTPPKSKVWADALQLDQGDTPHCVAFGFAHFLDAEPVTHTFDNDWAHALYDACKVIDGDNYDGTTIHTGAAATKNAGEISAYAWTDQLPEIKQWVLTKSGLVVGTWWTNDMFETDNDGFIYPTGSVAGGHGYLLAGYDEPSDVFTFQNSWSASWGLNGWFRMHADDWWSLFTRDGDGEACTAVEIA